MEIRILQENSLEYLIAITYAEAKGFLFEMFFGWRGTDKDGNAKIILTKKGWIAVEEKIKYYNKFIKNS